MKKVISCQEEKERHDYLVKLSFESFKEKPKTPKIVSWHGRAVEHLGSWDGYAAIRFDGSKSYEIIDPKYLRIPC